ncbi:MAG: ketoacyl-ACP synthase III [Candidatus Nitrohelix vancouverensis]|uniref:Ketoacyl-ACP synthase III n=1 Tax=Candidatus Nitrohelix vancouverensis TaxID=2705534 RepID=A0A7T0C071_9BACT|nr:MAG: ketoacyl-ACP synthase III [Candidatus Nitrohelix vancouverensis]
MRAAITAISYHLPEDILTGEDLAAEFPDWNLAKIEKKTGIKARHIARKGELSSDLAFEAAEKLFASGDCDRNDIDFLIFCTQSPDYVLPATACVLQDRLKLPITAGALDINQGCTGFIYGLSLAKGLIESQQAQRVLLLTAETYSKYMRKEDRSVRSIFGDGAAATIIEGKENLSEDSIGPFVFGTDGKGAKNLKVCGSGLRSQECAVDDDGAKGLFMNGPEVFNFTLRAVPQCIDDLLNRASISQDDVDLFIFHQANRHMLQHLRDKINIPEEKFVISLEQSGNTVSSTIPIALKESQDQNRIKTGSRIVLVGFGVGYSWGSTLIRWNST